MSDLRAAQELPRGVGTGGQKVQSALIQVAALAVLFLACFFIYRTTAANLARQGIASGFDFLWRRSGFAITPHLVPFDPEATFARALLVGLLNTLLLSTIAIVVSTVLGFLIGLARLSSNWLARNLALAYVETFRNIPLLLQIFFWYFGVLRALPGPRDSIALFDALFLNSRGLYVPCRSSVMPAGSSPLRPWSCSRSLPFDIAAVPVAHVMSPGRLLSVQSCSPSH